MDGPTVGGTVITISGINLGSSISEIESVMIGRFSCELISERYVISEEYVYLSRLKFAFSV